jgi:hypothetical protein
MTKPAANAEANKKSVTKKPASKDVNKSEEIRKVATGMKAKGEKPRPKTIIDVLKKQGITVSSPQVSMVLKRMGFRPRRRRAARETGKAQARASRVGVVSVEDLISAKKIVAQFGGTDRALAAITALKRLEG